MLAKPGMAIDLGGVAKGYAVDEIRKIYEDDSLDADQRQSAINEIQAYYQKKYEDLIRMQKDAAKDMNDAGNSALTEEQKIANRRN